MPHTPVIPGLVPGTQRNKRERSEHDADVEAIPLWVPGTGPGMTR